MDKSTPRKMMIHWQEMTEKCENTAQILFLVKRHTCEFVASDYIDAYKI